MLAPRRALSVDLLLPSRRNSMRCGITQFWREESLLNLRNLTCWSSAARLTLPKVGLAQFLDDPIPACSRACGKRSHMICAVVIDFHNYLTDNPFRSPPGSAPEMTPVQTPIPTLGGANERLF